MYPLIPSWWCCLREALELLGHEVMQEVYNWRQALSRYIASPSFQVTLPASCLPLRCESSAPCCCGSCASPTLIGLSPVELYANK